MPINKEYVPIDNQPTIKPRTVTGIFTRYIAKTLPLAFDESMSYYECLCALLEYINQTIVTDINNVNDGLEELQTFYEELQTYVNDYFKNLDVQEEINNKLDDMVEAGTLQEIISDYLNSKAVFGFDNLASMKNSTNLINGSYAKTLGYYSKNDGGEGLYKIRTITNDDIVDEMFIIEMNNDNTLIAELILKDSYINTNQAGLKANDSTFDNSTKFTSLISKCNSKGLNIEFNKGIYYFNSSIILNYRLQSMNIIGQGLPYLDYNNGTTLRYTGSGWFIDLNKCWKCNFKNFQIESNENGIKMSDIFFQSHLENVQFLNCKNAIHLKQFAYAYLKNIQINTNNTSSEYALRVGESATDTTEYLFVDGFINEDDAVYSGNNGIFIEKGIHLSFENMDLVKKFNAIKIEPVELVRYVFFNNVDIARSHIAYNLNAVLSFAYISIENSMISFDENADLTDRFMLLNKSSGKNIIDLKTRNVGGIALGTHPSYLIEFLAKNICLNSSMSIDFNPNDIPSKFYIDEYDTNVLTEYYQNLKAVNRVYNNSGTKTVTLNLLSNSPFNSAPPVSIQANRPCIKSYTLSNTNGGNLTATITLTDEFTYGTIIFYSEIIPAGIINQTLS